MQRNETGRRDGRRKSVEPDASQPAGGRPRPDDEEEESPQKPESAPNFLTARELQAREPAPDQEREKPQPGQKRGAG